MTFSTCWLPSGSGMPGSRRRQSAIDRVEQQPAVPREVLPARAARQDDGRQIVSAQAIANEPCISRRAFMHIGRLAAAIVEHEQIHTAVDPRGVVRRDRIDARRPARRAPSHLIW